MRAALPTSSAQASDARAEFYRRIDRDHLTPLWESLAQLVPPQPSSPCVPALWRYEAVRPHLMEAGRLISAQEAERRVLVMENPGLRGASSITRTLYAGLQLILPGERAPSHRHTQSALRFVVEGTGAYTAVNGEPAFMQPGDFIITPSWAYHDHANPGDNPVVWLDGLDIPMISFFDAGFAERSAEPKQALTRPDGDALSRYGAGLLPYEYQSPSLSTPLLSYPYARSRAALRALHRQAELSSFHGVKMQYSNPVTGGYPMPTIAAYLQLLPEGFRGRGYRSTDGTVYCVVEGHGRSRIGDQLFDWAPKDVFVVPSWCPVQHEADADSVLFSYSDRPVQKALGIWREDAIP
ncbi:MAG TPA: gentisate 1,2-dioxygenase [Polyangiaceae bacterium]|nr:gentisate 1,2-dioxygenase [Polyangiaceae bacterium]